MDWNNDGRVNGIDYALYKSVIDTGSGSSCGNRASNKNGSSGNTSIFDGMGSAKWIVVVIIVYVVLKLIGLD